MGGGIIQMILAGQQDQYITQNPQISYFKYAYKKHTNFAMESIKLDFLVNPELKPTGNDSFYRCNILRHGDLLSSLYFCFTLPDIYSSDTYKFRWIENIGNIFIKKATITVGGTEIDSLMGEWLSIWNELSLKDSGSYNKLIGNSKELNDPTINTPRIGIRNNRFYYSFYPSANKSSGDPPSIKAKTLYVPLNFWFTRNPALALPLTKLQLAEVYVTIYTRGSEYLYQVFSNILDTYVSPTYYNIIHNDNINLFTFTKHITLNPYIDATYIFLSIAERDSIILMSNYTNNNNIKGMQYVIEQVTASTETRISSISSTITDIDLNVHKHTKEIIWTIRRDDFEKYNIFNNYTASITYDEYKKILKSVAIIWDKTSSRIEKNADYFSYIQPYQHHTNVPRVGIYCYSFALFPEKVNPSGSYNASIVNTTLRLEVDGSYNNNEINEKLAYHNQNTYNFDYLVNIYTVTMNVFEVIGGTGGMKFA
jgi:hypothetical protein